MPETLKYCTFETPIGDMYAVSSDQGICLLEFTERKELNKELKELAKHFETDIQEGESDYLTQLKKELTDYFNGELKSFTIPLIFTGSDFQKKVWNALLEVPYGETRTYMEQTLVLGDPKAIRAVASANGRNKIAIVVPCHRIIGSDGSLTGYAGGIDRKRFLLNLEREIAGPRDLFSQ